MRGSGSGGHGLTAPAIPAGGDSDDNARRRRYIAEALVYASGSHTVDDVERLIAEGRLQCWPGPHSVIVTEVIEYPQYRALNFFLAGGEGSALGELERMYPIVEAWGRDVMGCTRAVFTGRLGWERTFLSRQGWHQQKLAVFEKPLDG